MRFLDRIMTGSALAVLALAAASAASAQDATPAPAPATTPAQPAPPPADDEIPADDAAPDDAQDDAASEDEADEVGEVLVTGARNAVRTSIDSVSYSLADDLQATSGTLADALRNIPSVDVDPEGNLSLRGDQNVTVLVDGRPSALFAGQSRAQVLQSIPADRYARIEVMTNPSAAYSPEGSGGVINLISKPNVTPPGQVATGSIRANVGNDGRWNLGANIVRTAGKTTLSGDLGVRHDAYIQELERTRRVGAVDDPDRLDVDQTRTVDGDSDVVFARAGVEHNLDDKTQLTGELRHTDVDSTGDALDLYTAVGQDGDIASAYRRDSIGRFQGQFSGATGRVLRRFDDQGHEWSNEIRFDRNRFAFGGDTVATEQIPVRPTAFESVDNETVSDQIGVTSAYVRPFASGAKLRLGYELQATMLETNNLLLRGEAENALVPDPTVTNEFHLDQTVHALYATYEKPFTEKLSAQFGLRLEQANLDLDQVTTDIQTSNDYFRAYPTFHVSYAYREGESVRASYSKRIQRPQPQDLNPFLTYQDEFNYSSGNPDLLPQETDSFELMWQKRVQQTFYQATAYYRDTSDAFTQVTTELGDGVFLTRPENLGASRSYGVELVANGALHPTLRYNASVNLYRQEIDASNLFGGQDREGEGITGRVTLNWQPTQKDFLQVTGIWNGDQLQAQGTREQKSLFNLGYRRKINDDWSFNLTARDLLDDFGDRVEIETETFSDVQERKFGGRAVFVGFTWNFGQGQRRPETFDFSAAPTGG